MMAKQDNYLLDMNRCLQVSINVLLSSVEQ
uniref:Uncharacterized protein n=1 Tax=Anguilla anguilla TaxID=7936 RepID=A0A0E9QUH7_ANGAN